MQTGQKAMILSSKIQNWEKVAQAPFSLPCPFSLHHIVIGVYNLFREVDFKSIGQYKQKRRKPKSNSRGNILMKMYGRVVVLSTVIMESAQPRDILGGKGLKKSRWQLNREIKILLLFICVPESWPYLDFLIWTYTNPIVALSTQ